jgi:hypothetical protein
MPYLVKHSTSMVNVNGDTFVHQPGTVLSDWEVSDFVREKVKEGTAHYRNLLEPLLPAEAHRYRIQATQNEPPHLSGKDVVPPPWDDYVGLHPDEVCERMRDSDLDKVAHVRRYERGGMNRQSILEFVHPAEHEPWLGYDDADVRDVLEKLAILSDPQVSDAIAYESAHKARPAVTEWDRESYEGPQSQTIEAGVGVGI